MKVRDRDRNRKRENRGEYVPYVLVEVTNTLGVSSSLPPYLRQGFSLTTAYTRLAGPQGSGESFVFLSFCHRITDEHYHVLFYMGSENSNSAHHTCIASILCMGHVPSSGNFFF